MSDSRVEALYLASGNDVILTASAEDTATFKASFELLK
jgi:hypothetical protein